VPHAWAAASGATAHTFVPALDERLQVAGADGHHLERVRRIAVGERVTAADGHGAWREYEVTAAAGGGVDLAAVGNVQHEPPLVPGLAVAFALTKRDQPEAVVRGLTELGVDRILPVVAARSQVRWRGDRGATEHQRLVRVMREAAVQCRRARLATVGGLGELASLAGHPSLVVAGRSGGPAAEVPDPKPEGPAQAGEWLLVVGPEGGLTGEEIGLLEGHHLAVGPYVLRAPTAAVATAAVLTARRRPPRARESHHGQ
jgi:16S rRNA (uracil1498-N3)-methyltransferase